MAKEVFGNIEVSVPIPMLVLYMISSILLGFLVAIVHMYKNDYTKNFIVTLITLPVFVQITILLVNGNLGTGVAVLGAFGLVRFRSAQGNARDMASIFWCLVVGLATGTGHVFYAGVFSVIIMVLQLILFNTSLGEIKLNKSLDKEIKLVVKEKYADRKKIENLFSKYSISYYLMKVEFDGEESQFSYRIKLNDLSDESKITKKILNTNEVKSLKISELHLKKKNKIL